MTTWIKLTTSTGNKALYNLEHYVSIAKCIGGDSNCKSVLSLPTLEECYVQETVEDIYATLAAHGLSISVS